MVRRHTSPVGRRNLGPLPKLIRARLVNTISFYFSNLHDNTNRRELWKVFGGCGRVRDVFIHRRETKRGIDLVL